MPTAFFALFDHEKADIMQLNNSIELLCPGYSAANRDAPVNVSECNRPMLKLLGSKGGVAVVEDAKASHKKRAGEEAVSIAIHDAEEELKELDSCIQAGSDRESVLDDMDRLKNKLAKVEELGTAKTVRGAVARIKDRVENALMTSPGKFLGKMLRDMLGLVTQKELAEPSELLTARLNYLEKDLQESDGECPMLEFSEVSGLSGTQLSDWQRVVVHARNITALLRWMVLYSFGNTAVVPQGRMGPWQALLQPVVLDCLKKGCDYSTDDCNILTFQVLNPFKKWVGKHARARAEQLGKVVHDCLLHPPA